MHSAAPEGGSNGSIFYRTTFGGTRQHTAKFVPPLSFCKTKRRMYTHVPGCVFMAKARIPVRSHRLLSHARSRHTNKRLWQYSSSFPSHTYSSEACPHIPPQPPTRTGCARSQLNLMKRSKSPPLSVQEHAGQGGWLRGVGGRPNE